MIKLESEFEFKDEVYIIKDSEIIKTTIRKIKFPTCDWCNAHPRNDQIQYGCCTEKKLNDLWGTQENDSWYDWRFERETGRTKNELLDKLKD